MIHIVRTKVTKGEMEMFLAGVLETIRNLFQNAVAAVETIGLVLVFFFSLIRSMGKQGRK